MRYLFLPLLFALLIIPTIASAQAPAEPNRMVLTKTVEPSFRIEPVVLRFEARRGEVIPFAFAISSLGKEMDVEVQPVKLRQEESGIILHGDAKTDTEGLRIETAQKFKLAPGTQQTIAGTLTVPIAKTNYLSCGILVRETGTKPNFEDSSNSKTKAGIRFVTQYVLRVDVETGISGVGSMGELKLEEGQLVDEHGLPKLATYLNNPTDFSYECYVSASLSSKNVKKSSHKKPIRLGMQSRRTLDEDKRYLVRIMPNSRLLLEAPIDEVISPGDQLLEVGVSSVRREVFARSFPILVGEDDFPALTTERAIVGEGVSISPAQIELGTIKGVKRTVPLQLQNLSEAPANVTLELKDLSGNKYTQVKISPSSFTLNAGRTKNIRAMLRSGGTSITESCRLEARVEQANGKVETIELPLAVLRQPPKRNPKLSLSEIEWISEGNRSGFNVAVTNDSSEYVPVNAVLSLNGESGTSLLLESGYGVWIAPGAKKELRFIPTKKLPADQYTIQLVIVTREGAEPLTRELNISLEGESMASRHMSLR